ncbi:hypothetical protein GCM10027418_18790 [Mariniluteicoccus endophyticus]
MVDNAINSLMVGGALSLVLFIPFVIWQYRRYGEIAELRLGLMCALLVYCAALIAYTMFPLPQTLSDAWCARHQRLNLDPIEAVRRVQSSTAGLPLHKALMDFSVLEMVFNVALFVPLGWFGRRIGEWKVLTTALVGLGTSLLIEVTQFTGVYGVFKCAYRLADVIDLFTNTTGTLVGVALATLFPHLFPTSDELEATADRARPVDKGRRWLSQVLDMTYFLVVWAVAAFFITLVYRYLGRVTLENPTPAVEKWLIAANVIVVVFALVATISGDGSSLGQRTTYLRPVRDGRAPEWWRRLLRPLAVMVPVAVLIFGQDTWVGQGIGLVWALAAILSIFFTRRGLSGLAAGVEYVDSRDPAYTSRKPAPETIDA